MLITISTGEKYDTYDGVFIRKFIQTEREKAYQKGLDEFAESFRKQEIKDLEIARKKARAEAEIEKQFTTVQTLTEGNIFRDVQDRTNILIRETKEQAVQEYKSNLIKWIEENSVFEQNRFIIYSDLISYINK
jgi:hypothetical protein